MHLAATILCIALVLPLAVAAALPAPPNVTAAMAKAFPDATSTYTSAAGGSMTVFCRSDDVVAAFAPRYKNLNTDSKASLLLYHAVPVYYSPGTLKSNNGVMNMLSTDGSAMNYNFTLQNEGNVINIKMVASFAVAMVKSTLLDTEPVVVYAADKVVEPVEVFKPAP